jgi:hypothetical protein
MGGRYRKTHGAFLIKNAMQNILVTNKLLITAAYKYVAMAVMLTNRVRAKTIPKARLTTKRRTNGRGRP